MLGSLHEEVMARLNGSSNESEKLSLKIRKQPMSLKRTWKQFESMVNEISRARRWGELSPQAKRLFLGVGAYLACEKAFTWHHVYHTPEKRLRGNRKAWFAATGLVDFFGPLAFFIWGRKPKK